MNPATTTIQPLDQAGQRAQNRAARTLHRALTQLQRKFTVDEYNRSVLIIASRWLAQVECPEFQVGQGLLLSGPVGTGKTDLMNAISRAISWSGGDGFPVVNVKRVEKEFNRSDSGDKQANGGDAVILRYANLTHVCFDDLGVEEDGKHYGRAANVMQDIIALRYERWRRGECITHFTTNATPKQLAERYDTRTLSRLVEMCSQVQLSGPDRRMSSAPPNAARLLRGLFDDPEVQETVPPEKAQEYFSQIRETIAATVASMAPRKGVVLSINGASSLEQQLADVVERIPDSSTEDLQRYRDVLAEQPNEWNTPVVQAIDQELGRRATTEPAQP